MGKRVLVIGEACVDLIVTGLDRIPDLGAERMADDISVQLGGSSLNTACGLARLGVETAFCGKLGDDLFGRFVREQAEHRGLDFSRVTSCHPIRTGVSVALNVGGDRAFATYGGSITAGCYEDLPAGLFEGFDHAHMGSFFLLGGLQPGRIAREAKSAGLTFSLDTGYDPSERWDGGLEEALGHVDFFLINEVEARAIAREPDIARAARKLAGRCEGLAVKLGARGSMFTQGGRLWKAEGMRVDRVVDTTGAGDAFNAGFLAGWLEGEPFAECLRWGNAAGGFVAQAAGAIPGQPDRARAREAGAGLGVREMALGEWDGG